MAIESSSTGVKGFVKDAALAAIASTALDFFVEVAGLPYLNDPSPIPLIGHEQTVIESILVGAGLVGVSLGGLSVFAGKSLIPGFGATALAYGTGILAGTSFYENQLVKTLHIRNIRHGVYR